MRINLLLPLILLPALLAPGCSVRRFAVNRIGDALASGGSTYESDDDLELVGGALPFSLKLVESLLAESPRHKGLLVAACQGFSIYSYIYVQNPADVLADSDLDQARQMRARARRLYLRAQGYGFRALEAAYPGTGQKMLAEPKAALALAGKKSDVPMLYWNAVALGLAMSVSKNEAAMLARLPEVEALIDRALELDPGWNDGALYEFQVTFASARPGKPDYARIRKHFDQALALSRGKRAAIYVAYAEAVSVPRQDRAEFQSMLEKALAIEAEANQEGRLANLLAQRRARWLLGRADELILSAEAPGEKP